MEVALEAGADDIVTNDDQSIDVLTTPDAFLDVKQAMLKAGVEPEMAEVTMSPATSVDLGLEDVFKDFIRGEVIAP